MKSRFSKAIEIFVESINYIIVSYALSCMAMFFKTSPFFILFFASEIWIFSKYWRTLQNILKSKWLSVLIWIFSFLVLCLMLYFLGYIDGRMISFAS